MKDFRKIFMLMAVALLMLMSHAAMAMAGEGTGESPFLITNQAELEMITDFPDCHFKLMNDIVLEGKWTPLCKETTDKRFYGEFDGAGYTISGLSTGIVKGGLFCDNNGTIKNLKVIIADGGMKGSGGIADYNYGTISNCSVRGNINCPDSSYRGGICGYNEEIIANCAVIGNVIALNYIGGICGYNRDRITDCYFIGRVSSNYSYIGGIVGYNHGYNNADADITNCYAVPTFSSGGHGIGYDYYYSKFTNSYYNETVSGLTSTYYGKPRSTAEMKNKQTYTCGGWNFDNVWGIDANINDGYPYLLWEYPEKSSASAEIIGVTSIDSTLKFITKVYIEGEPDIATFGTTFIPLWLFEIGSGDTATVEYDNSNYNITNARTYDATLTGIPESCKSMDIVGKSYIKDSNGVYTWSTAKKSSVNKPTLNLVK